MMTKLVLVLFTALTLGAGYLTLYHVGVEDGAVVRSVRDGSVAGSARASRIK